MKNNKAICMLGVLAVSIFLVFNQAIESSEILDESTVSNDPGLDPNPLVEQIVNEYEALFPTMLSTPVNSGYVRYSNEITIDELSVLVGMSSFDEELSRQTTIGTEDKRIKYFPTDEARFADLTGSQDSTSEMNQEDLEHFKYKLYKQTVKKNEYTGRVVFIDNRSHRTGQMMSDEEAEDLACYFFQALNLPEDEVACVRVDRVDHDYFIEGVGPLPGTDHVQTYVRIEREVNGFGFPASQFLIRVGPNTQLQKIEANWPAVEFPPGIESRPSDEVANELSQIIEGASTEYHYWFHLVPIDGPDHRFYLPTLRVKEPNFFTEDGMEIAGRVHTIVLAE